jgi:hypothetical protein
MPGGWCTGSCRLAMLKGGDTCRKGPVSGRTGIALLQVAWGVGERSKGSMRCARNEVQE